MAYVDLDPLSAFYNVPSTWLAQLLANTEALHDGTGLANGNQILAYTSVAGGSATSSSSYSDVTSVSVTFTAPAFCTQVLLIAEYTVSSGTGGMNYFQAITDNSNNIQVERSWASIDNNVNHLSIMHMSRRITVTPGNTYTFKLRHKSNGSAGCVINQGDNANSPTILYVQRV